MVFIDFLLQHKGGFVSDDNLIPLPSLYTERSHYWQCPCIKSVISGDSCNLVRCCNDKSIDQVPLHVQRDQIANMTIYIYIYVYITERNSRKRATLRVLPPSQFSLKPIEAVSECTIMGSEHGLSPGRRKAIIWTNYKIVLIWTLTTNFGELLREDHVFASRKMHFKMSSAKWRQICLVPMC